MSFCWEKMASEDIIITLKLITNMSSFYSLLLKDAMVDG